MFQSKDLISTRDNSGQIIPLQEAILRSQPSDGGLYTFRNSDFPKFGIAELLNLQNLSFQDLAKVILGRFDLGISRAVLSDLVDAAYGKQWYQQAITPVTSLNGAKNLYLLELYHGPTFAFKDIALQFLPRYLALHTDKTLRALGASSGDTISAAHFGVAGLKNLQSIFLLPQNGPSKVQRMQSTRHGLSNAMTILIDGDFDCAQAAIKTFNSPDYAELKAEYNFISFNSIQILRILCQITYYFSAYLQLVDQGVIKIADEIDFSVPSGNFGDALAGEFAREMGLPIRQINIATNANDILDRFLQTGIYRPPVNSDGTRADALITRAPSQDITVSSNFERELYLAKADPEQISTWMDDLKLRGEFEVDTATLKYLQGRLSSSRASDQEIIDTQLFVYRNFAKIIDPHTATGVKPYLHFSPTTPTVCLATAHPLKFEPPHGLPVSDEYQEAILALKANEENYISSKADLDSIEQAVKRGIDLMN